jgi:2-polyprenyl-3-methyl-5-hydroxy-6-metoxy-1,4-benzoquinol methylase
MFSPPTAVAAAAVVASRSHLELALNGKPEEEKPCHIRDDVSVTDDVLADQVAYYRRRAGEYDVTAYGDVAVARTRIDRLVSEVQPTGKVLEIACGTGMWTGALAGVADMVTAIDAAPEAIDIARARVRSAKVTFEVADVFSWTTSARFDVIFFSAWLSHVPISRLEEFWQLLRRRLVADGRVLFIDEHVDVRHKESYVAGRDEIVERRLDDGEMFHIIKNFVDPPQLEAWLRGMGWDCEVRRDGGDWVCGEARPAAQPRGPGENNIRSLLVTRSVVPPRTLAH